MNLPNHRSSALLCLLLLAYLAYCLPLLPLSADDIRMAEVFSIDEADIFLEVKRLVSVDLTSAPSFKYGGAFYYPPVLVLKTLGLVTEVAERTVILAVRAFGTAAGAVCLVLTCLLGSLVFDRRTAGVAALLLAVNPEFLRWSVEAHPDLPQLAWIVGCLLCCSWYCHRPRTVWLVAAAACAGAAFGTKYAGGFLLPVVLAAVVLPGQQNEIRWKEILNRLRSPAVWAAALIVVCFVGAFAATSPHAVIRLSAFRKSLMAEKAIMEFGHTFRADPRGVLWLGVLVGLAGAVNTAAFGIAVLGSAMGAYRRKGLPAERALLLLWIVLFVSYLILEVDLRRSRHLLPVLPAVLLFAAHAYTRAFEWCRERFAAAWWTGAVLPCLVILAGWGAARHSAEVYVSRWHREEGRVELEAGRWMSDEYPARLSILHDAYSYIPSKFRYAFRTFGMSLTGVSHFEPDVLVVRRAIASDFSDPQNAERSWRGAQNYLDRHYFYAYLRDGLIPDFALDMDFGEVAVYRRSTSKVRHGAHPDSLWTRLVRHYRGSRAHGVAEAHRTMGDIHASMGRKELAEASYGRARETKNYPVRLYNLAIRRLLEGHVQTAVDAFDEIGRMIETKPSGYRATVHRDFARQLIDAAAYGPAVVQARKAAALDPEMMEAQFDLAAACLGSGAVDLADSAYEAAVERFGRDPGGEADLRDMMARDVQAAAAARLLEAHYSR